MRLSDDLHVLVLPVPFLGALAPLHLSLILDPRHGPTLVDTGVPGGLGALDAALSEVGLGLRDLRRVIVTHGDADHVGSLAEVVRASGARVLAHGRETPYIDGRLRPLKLLTPEEAGELLPGAPPELRALRTRRPEPAWVDEALRGGQRLDLAGGVRVIHTPGHTPGHLSLYLERSRTLISGDAVLAREGRLTLPPGPTTPDMAEAVRSIGRLAALDIETVVAHHGGVVRDDIREQLRALEASRA